MVLHVQIMAALRRRTYNTRRQVEAIAIEDYPVMGCAMRPARHYNRSVGWIYGVALRSAACGFGLRIRDARKKPPERVIIDDIGNRSGVSI